MQKGIRFFRCIWESSDGVMDTTEAAYSRRALSDRIKAGQIEYYHQDSQEKYSLLKIQEYETPMIELEWLLKLFTTAGNAKEREAHREQAAYVLRLVELTAARVHLENGDYIER